MAFRGGFNGGSRNTGGMMGGQKLPFDIDAGLDDEIAKYRDEDPKKEALAKDPKELYPSYPGGVPRAPPVTAREKQMVRRYREYTPSATRDPCTQARPARSPKMQTGSKRSAAEFNAFEDQETYGKKFQKTEWNGGPDLTKHKFAQPHLFPKDLWTTIGYNPAADPAQANRRKKLTLARPSIVDKLARFDDDAADHDDVEGEEDEAVGAGEDEDGEAADELQDDDFEEDEDDGNDDYNAEQYFDGGDDDFEEGGGGVEEYGGGGGDDGF
ncbi:DNA-directed RNA polymerase III subunit RPC7-like [Teratosphaeria destructans]|uniref:DNA-directed RNA polymerase III subunit RPC7-like n=1 Tax=Teratosphaeria destructans TaxID=418781 RepID=A0A9W7W719_9PEZI|nr:DNA-directed RNA polymerase III subunit RPC7-like [Teratosphaeria destructans]